MCFAALWVSPSLVVAHWCARGLTRASPLARMIANPITVIVIILGTYIYLGFSCCSRYPAL